MFMIYISITVLGLAYKHYYWSFILELGFSSPYLRLHSLLTPDITLHFKMSAAPPPQQQQPYQNGYHYTPLTKDNLKQLPVPPHSNQEAYEKVDQNFERVPLGLNTNRVDGITTLRAWEEQWAAAGRT